MKGISTALLLGSLVAISPSHAQEDLELTLGGSLMRYDSDRLLKNRPLIDLGLGLPINSSVTVEGWLSGGDTKVKNTAIDVDQRRLGLKLLHHYAPSSAALRPYAALGLHHLRQKVTGSNTDKDTLAQLGLGLKYRLSDAWQLRSELQAFQSRKPSNTDLGLHLGISYLFGGTKAAMPAPAPLPMPAKDSDGDGVFDKMDQCPNTVAGKVVDAKGCVQTITDTVSTELKINFASNSDVVPQSGMVEIRRVVDFMQRYANTEVEIQGHTDNRGDSAYNKDLSRRRADAVRNVMVDKLGIAPDRVSAVGYGEDRPIADNNSREGRASNRRVVAEISSQQTRELSQ